MTNEKENLREVVVFIDKEQYKVSETEITESVIRKLAGIPVDYVIFKVNHGQDEDLLIEGDIKVSIKNGDHFYSHKKFINNGSVTESTLMTTDIQFLERKGYQYELRDGDHSSKFLIIKEYPVSSIYNQSKVEILIVIPKMYPMNGLDMFWVYPDIKLAINNTYPPAADFHEIFLGRNWQRFSRHYNWRPNVDSLINHLSYINKELN